MGPTSLGPLQFVQPNMGRNLSSSTRKSGAGLTSMKMTAPSGTDQEKSFGIIADAQGEALEPARFSGIGSFSSTASFAAVTHLIPGARPFFSPPERTPAPQTNLLGQVRFAVRHGKISAHPDTPSSGP